MHPIGFSFVKSMTLALLTVALAAHASASTEKVLYTFTGGNDGGLPVAGLILDKSGNLYGSAAGGGSQACNGGCGLIFELSPNSAGGWSEKVLYSFTGGNDGSYPEARLIADNAGNLYGTALNGGSGACGCGTVFELKPNGDGSWTEITLHSFTGGMDGENPNAPLVFGKAGNFFGTTFFGGVPTCYADVGCGTVFELRPTASGWSETVLYRFTGGTDGAFLRGGLILDKAGSLFGTTEAGGGTGCYGLGCGTIFSLGHTKAGWKESVLYSFGGSTDGAFPEAGLTQDAAGKLYGTTGQGGDANCNVGGGLGGCGVVFEMSNSTGKWKQTVLYSFTGGQDASFPLDGVSFYGANLYGTTQEGGGSGCFQGNGCGAVFELKSSQTGWAESILHSFSDGNDGASAQWGSVIFDHKGNLFGTTQNGGAYEQGTVFEVTP